MTKFCLNPMASSQWVHDHYQELVRDYDGYFILVRENQVVFSAKEYNAVLSHAKSTFTDDQWEIEQITQEKSLADVEPELIKSDMNDDIVFTGDEAKDFITKLESPGDLNIQTRKKTIEKARQMFRKSNGI